MDDHRVYQNGMSELKSRLKVLVDFVGKQTTGSEIIDAEFCCLQIRKILELVALSSIAPNTKAYAAARANLKGDFTKDWNAAKILKSLKEINPGFYPRPLIQTISGGKFSYEEKTGGFLTEENLVNIYHRCGGILHASNPFTNRDRFKGMQKNLINWPQLIWQLVNTHTIKVLGSDEIWLIHMGEITKPGVHIALAKPKT